MTQIFDAFYTVKLGVVVGEVTVEGFLKFVGIDLKLFQNGVNAFPCATVVVDKLVEADTFGGKSTEHIKVLDIRLVEVFRQQTGEFVLRECCMLLKVADVVLY